MRSSRHASADPACSHRRRNPPGAAPPAADSVFSGRDATIQLATMQLDPAKIEGKQEDDLTEEEQKTLQDWIAKYRTKYPVVARLEG